MKQIIVILLITSGLFSAKISAQTTLPRQFAVYCPDYITNMKGNPFGLRSNQQWQDWCIAKIKSNDFGKNTKTVWTVYSDRENNTTYSNPNVYSDVFGKVDFREKLFVAKISNGFALVFTDDYKSIYPSINSTAGTKGWIPVENLLLWEECPKNQNQIYQKGLIVHDPGKQNAYIEKNPPYLLSPDPKSNPGEKKARDLDILFIMKTANSDGATYYLLSKEMNCKDQEQHVLYGWLPEDYVTRWDQRLVLEPTFASAAVRNYKEKKLAPAIYDKLEQAKNFYSRDNLDRPFWVYDDFGFKRMNANRMRNPIIEEQATHIFKVAAISSLNSKKMAGEEIAKISADIEKHREQLKNINLIFVIDATSSMNKYYKAVTDALSDIMRRDYISKYNVKVGAVLYKDYKDPDKIDYKPVTSRIGEIIAYLSSSANRIGSIDPDDYEAMFLGLETALDMNRMNYSKTNSNFMILIGDAGNHRKDPQGRNWQQIVSNLSQKMSDNNINFLAYQVNNANRTAYEDFALQVGVLQKEFSEYIRSKLQIAPNGVEFKLKSNRFYTLTRKNNSEWELPVYDTYKYASSGQSETTVGLQNIITSSVTEFQEVVQQRIRDLSAQLISKDEGIDSGSGFKEERLKENFRLLGWTESRINNYISYLKQGGSAKLIGYAPEKTNNSKYKLFDYVLFFSQDELTELIQMLSPLISTNNINLKKSYQDAVISMGQAMLGHFDEAGIRNMDMDELLSQIYGVPIKMQSCGIKIDRIINMNRLELNEYVKKFSDKLQGLKNISTNSYDGRFKSNGITYYWIPFSDMPGFCEEN
jgi:hypothetical protein